jgi:hypothetical protein
MGPAARFGATSGSDRAPGDRPGVGLEAEYHPPAGHRGTGPLQVLAGVFLILGFPILAQTKDEPAPPRLRLQPRPLRARPIPPCRQRSQVLARWLVLRCPIPHLGPEQRPPAWRPVLWPARNQ